MMRFALILALANASVVKQHARGEHPAVKIIALLQKLQAQVKQRERSAKIKLKIKKTCFEN